MLRRLGFEVVAIMPSDDEDNAEFKGTAWTGRVYVDKERGFYRYLGEGDLRRASYWSMLTSKFFKLLKLNRVHGVTGTVKTGGKDGNVLGGILLVNAGEGGVAQTWKEETFADFGDLGESEF